MSRALDQETATSIGSGNLRAIYDDVVQALCSNTSSDLLEIEILGKSHPLPAGCNVLVDGNSIAIPKVKLVQAFVVARQIFFNSLESFLERQREIRSATAVILLLDPEHLTAANARKRLIQISQARPEELKDELTRELRWIDSMLTARLHRHTKSPTLWSHRRWIIQRCRSMQMPRDTQQDLTSVVLVAAERHPRNYYAWLHMRWLLQSQRAGSDSARLDGRGLLSAVLTWCLKHPADTSGFSFLLFCLQHTEDITGAPSQIEANSSVCSEVLRLAVSFRWVHESVWVFLRTLVALGVTEEQRTGFFEAITTFLGAQPDTTARPILQAAHDWCIAYERPGVVSSDTHAAPG